MLSYFEIDEDWFRVIIRRKEVNTLKTTQETRVKTRVKTRGKIVELIKQNPSITIPEIAEELDLTIKGIEWNIAKLKNEKTIKRIGSTKGGHWELL